MTCALRLSWPSLCLLWPCSLQQSPLCLAPAPGPHVIAVAFAVQGCLSNTAAALLPANLVGLIGSLLTNCPRPTVEQALQQHLAAAPAQLAASRASLPEGDSRQAGGHTPLERGALADSAKSAALLQTQPAAGATAALGGQAQPQRQQPEGAGAAEDQHAELCGAQLAAEVLQGSGSEPLPSTAPWQAWAAELVAVPRVVLFGLSLMAAGRLGRPELAVIGLNQPSMRLGSPGQPSIAAAGRPAAVGQAGQQPVQGAHDQPAGALGNLAGTSASQATQAPVSQEGVEPYHVERQRRIEVRAELLLCVSLAGCATGAQHLMVRMQGSCV